MICEFCSTPALSMHAVLLGESRSTLWRCPTCHSCQTSPAFPESQVRAYYENGYFTREAWQVRKAAVLSADYLTKARRYSLGHRFRGRALEIGAGYGFFARLAQAELGLPVDVVEPNRDCCEFIRTQRPAVDVVAATIDELPSSSVYSAVFCFHTVEHLQRLGPFLARLSDHLLPGGMAWILTPNGAARGFTRLGEQWSWACPDQHYQFVSHRVPAHFFSKFGLSLRLARDVAPATIHYPSLWHRHLTMLLDDVTGRIDNSAALHGLHWRLARRFLYELQAQFLLNKRAEGFASLEKFWSIASQRRPLDELLLVLQKD